MPTARALDVAAAVDAAVRIVGVTPRPAAGPLVVAVDGRSGAGKTTYAAALAEALDAPIVHLDDIYPGWDGLERGVQILATCVLEPLRAGEPAAYPRWDWTKEVEGDWVTVPSTDLLVVEGVGASAEPADPLVDVVIWLEADVAIRKARALARDGETFAPHWDQWAAEEDDLFDGHHRHRPRLVVDTGEWADLTGGSSSPWISTALRSSNGGPTSASGRS